MERHRKEKEFKALKALYRESCTLFIDEETEQLSKWRWRCKDEFFWVPVEKPQFIGWEASLTLSDTAARRSDGHILYKALQITGLSKPRFFKDPSVVSTIRRAGKVYRTTITLWQELQRRKNRDKYYFDNSYPKGVSAIGDGKLRVEEFEKLDHKEQRYFDKQSKTYPASAYHDGFTEYWYTIGGLFPIHELRIKLDTAYSTHKGIPKSDELSRESEIDKVLYNNFYWDRNYNHKSSWERNDVEKLKRHRKRAYNTICKEISMVADKEEAEDHFIRLEARRIKRRL